MRRIIAIAAAAPSSSSRWRLREASFYFVARDSTSSAMVNGEQQGLLERYESMIKTDEIKHDPHQVRSLSELDRLRLAICPSFRKPKNDDVGGIKNGKHLDAEMDEGLNFFPLTPRAANIASENNNSGGSSSGVMSIFDGFLSWPMSDDDDTTFHGARKKNAQVPPTLKGVYLHGGVGCGKTYCMNLFYDSLPSSLISTLGGKQKVHFHQFMLNIHRQMHLAKQMKGLRGDDIINYVIQSTIAQGKILCFDEFQVTDVADALILKRLFTGLIDNGTIIVATSNRPPKDLYKGGLQRDLFLPFIDLLEEKCTVVSMWESNVDYRMVGSSSDNAKQFGGSNSMNQRVYFADDDNNNLPNSSAKSSYLELFRMMTKDSIVAPMALDVRGRRINIPYVSTKFEVARFSFDDLCRMPKGAADYLTIGEMYHTIFIDDVPTLKSNEVNLVRRWITLIDVMYECNVRVIIHATSDPANIFQVDLNSVTDEGFAFDRTRSRMEEMRSNLYLTKRWVGAKYDVNGDGILDAEELATRDKDRPARITSLDSI